MFARQLLTYLKIMNLRPGLLMNFGMASMKAGIRRIAQLSGSRPVAPCPPCPSVRTMPIPCTGSPIIVTVFVNPTTSHGGRRPSNGDPGNKLPRGLVRRGMSDIFHRACFSI